MTGGAPFDHVKLDLLNLQPSFPRGEEEFDIEGKSA
jgi:hypothetical protein